MNGSSSYNHRWEWLSSNLNTASNLQEFEWTIYDDEIQTILNDALEKKLKSVIKNLQSSLMLSLISSIKF